MLPNVSPIVDCRGIPELTQHFYFPVLSEVCELGCWHWPIADFVDVSDSVIQRTLGKPFRWIVLERPYRLFVSDTLANFVLQNIFTPSAIPSVSNQQQLSLLVPSSRQRASLLRPLTYCPRRETLSQIGAGAHPALALSLLPNWPAAVIPLLRSLIRFFPRLNL
jgi:hypothetical protein